VNKFEKIYLPLYGAIITVLLNIIMFIQTFITKANYDVFSNFVGIISVLILYRVNYYAVKIGMERRVRLEYYGILFYVLFL
jgi:amino acid permease